MKILTILGTRPEIIRLSRVIPKLDKVVDHAVLHTGQNYDHNLNDIFFNQLQLRSPDSVIDSESSTFSEQLGKILTGVETYVNHFKPDRVLLLGDTNSCLSAIVCERLGIPVYHMEAGNRCNDLKVPEEKNRKLIDSISSINLPYTELSRQNLLREGFPNDRIFVTGNPIKEVMDHYMPKIDNSPILDQLSLSSGEYVVVTAHRAENVDDKLRLNEIFKSLNVIATRHTVVFSCHPRTRSKLQLLDIELHKNIIMVDPMGFFDFIKLEKNSLLAITDSGTVQEEMCLLNKATVTIRDTTERPETVWCGSNIVTGLNSENILLAFNRMKQSNQYWDPPSEYVRNDVSDVVVNILMSNR